MDLDRDKPAANRLTRRDFLISTVATAGLILSENSRIALAADLLHSNPQPPLQSPVYAQALHPLDAIKKMESDMGNNPLSVDQGKEMIHLGAEWLATRRDGILKDPTFLEQNTFILTNGPQTLAQPLRLVDIQPQNDPIVINFFKTYPDIEYSEAFAIGILNTYHGRDGIVGLGTVPPFARAAFINIDYTNNSMSYLGRLSRNKFQYLGTDPTPITVPLTKTTVFRSTVQHEGFHLDDWGRVVPLDPEIVEYVRRNYPNDPSNVIFSGASDNFTTKVTIQVGTESAQSTTKNDFNEFCTDHQGIRLSQDGDLPFWISYGQTPESHFNFKQVLDQAGLSFSEFNRYYKGPYLKEFYVKIAQAAQRSETDEGKIFDDNGKVQDMLDFSIPRFPWYGFPVWNPNPEDNRPEMKRHFPGIILPNAD